MCTQRRNYPLGCSVLHWSRLFISELPSLVEFTCIKKNSWCERFHLRWSLKCANLILGWTFTENVHLWCVTMHNLYTEKQKQNPPSKFVLFWVNFSLQRWSDDMQIKPEISPLHDLTWTSKLFLILLSFRAFLRLFVNLHFFFSQRVSLCWVCPSPWCSQVMWVWSCWFFQRGSVTTQEEPWCPVYMKKKWGRVSFTLLSISI